MPRASISKVGRAAPTQACAPSPTASDVISKTNEPHQLRHARQRHQSRTSLARRTSCSSSGKCVIAIGPGHHQQDGRAAAAPERASLPSVSDVISKTNEPQQLSQARHRHRSRTSSAKRTSSNSLGSASLSTTSDVFSKTDEPHKLSHARHRQRSRSSSAIQTSRISSGTRAIDDGLGHHRHDERAAAAQASASSPSVSDAISMTDEPHQLRQARRCQLSQTTSALRTSRSIQASAPRQLSQARHRHRPRTSSARRTSRAAQARTPSPTASDIISKSDEPHQLLQARHRHRSRTLSAKSDEPQQLRHARHRQRSWTLSARRTSRPRESASSKQTCKPITETFLSMTMMIS